MSVPNFAGDIVDIAVGNPAHPIGFGFLRPLESGCYQLRAELRPSDWAGLKIISGLCRDRQFLMYGGRISGGYGMQLAVNARDLFVARNYFDTESSASSLEILDGIRGIMLQFKPSDVAPTFGLRSGLPLAVGGDFAVGIDYAKLDEPISYEGSMAAVTLHRLSRHFEDAMREVVADSHAERVVVEFHFSKIVDVEQARIAVKALRILLLYMEGSAEPESVDVVLENEYFMWRGAEFSSVAPGFDRPNFRLGNGDLLALIRLMHDFIFRLVEIPHVVEVLGEIVFGQVPHRYQVTLLGTAWEHVVESSSSANGSLKVRDAVAATLAAVTQGDAEVGKLIDLSWNTYNKLKHRNLRSVSNMPTRMVVDDRNIDDMELLASFMTHVVVVMILHEIGFAAGASILAGDLVDVTTSAGTIQSKYGVLLRNHSSTDTA
ncbi:hypothetical protein [Nocardia sp. NPDC060259]|uniref:hypothetical protein n=1 Tax=Nocardia sp. NPDC060259 TaxID=3347088 RepID=UPI00365A7557